MKKLIGSKKKGVAVFISGKGSNLKNLINFSKSKKSPILIKLIISNSVNAKGLVYAKKYKIQKKIYNFKIKKSTEEKILILMKKKKIDLICLAGFMKILSKNFIRKFKKKIINIHPSLLPKYKGLDTHQRVLLNKEKYTGCSVHYVSSKLDSGKIILQKKIKILKKDNATSLSKRVLKEEHKLYPKAILKIFS
tara:strand:- start:637 stop:1215 length:579 start_codon:yes stop_codon:yes gene_type:complete